MIVPNHIEILNFNSNNSEIKAALGFQNNVNVISVEEWELLSFFEFEPSKLDNDVPWSYKAPQLTHTSVYN